MKRNVKISVHRTLACKQKNVILLQHMSLEIKQINKVTNSYIEIS